MSAAGPPDAVNGSPPSGSVMSTLVESTLETGTEVRFAVDGRSMLPFIRPGDVVRVRPMTESRPEIGQVVAFRRRSGGGLLVHRVVKRRGDILVLRGDNTAQPDGEYAANDILGVVTAVERNGRSVWFGAGTFGRLVAYGTRNGHLHRVTRVTLAARRRFRACLKFLSAATRLRRHKGDDGNE